MRKIRHLPENVQAHACYYYGMRLGNHVKKWHRAVIRLEKEILAEEKEQRRKKEQQLLDELELLIQAMEEKIREKELAEEEQRRKREKELLEQLELLTQAVEEK